MDMDDVAEFLVLIHLEDRYPRRFFASPRFIGPYLTRPVLGHGGCLCASDVPTGAKRSEAATEGSGVRLHPDDRRSASDASEGMENHAPR